MWIQQSINIELLKTSQNKEYYSYIYFYLKTELIENYIKSRLAGSTQQYISLGELRKIPIIIPNNEILNKFRKISEKQLEKIYFNIQEIQSLTEIRDTLLPKLMSGEIEV
ncbi:restriction endonuclease subunit S [Cetobacterium sp. 2G large]|uniref:restriction endonuclease subunit S n=1 Tax=Cetobacterium sp. 2G large TaxID=2759680 RepID=UPI00163CEBC3|nr:restriction endonuclease subunit S [Cetobacterium sp. 2G large]